MKLITLALVTVVLYGSDTCYTVQLLSTNSSKNNTKMLEGREYPDECKLMEIGSTLTVRCGCYEKIDAAQKELPKFKSKYKEAVVASTYKYRFDDVAKSDTPKNDTPKDDTQKNGIPKNDVAKNDIVKSIAPEVPKKTEVITVLPSHEEIFKDEDAPAPKKEVVAPDALPATESSQEDSEKSKKDKKKKDKVKNKEDKIKKEEEERKRKEEEEKKKEEDIEKNKKDKKKDKKKKDKVKNKEDKIKKEEEERKRKEEEEKKKKEEEDKKRKEEEERKRKEEEDRRKKEGLTYVKKRDTDFSYERYLKPLKSTSGKKPFDYRYEFGAQLAYDMAYINEADASYHETDWRRVRLYHKGSFFNKKLFYEGEYSPIGDSKYKDVFIGYQNSIKLLSTDYRVKLGNLKVPFSLEGYTSSKYITFMERSLNDAFEESRKLGVELLSSTHFGGSYVNLFGSAFSNSIDERINDEISTPGYSGRLTYAHEFSKNHLFSFGGGFMSQDIGDESIKFKQGSESEWVAEKYVSVKVKNVDTLRKRNVEVLYINNSFSLQGEYVTALVDSTDGNYAFDAYYMQGSYFIIGNGREYKFGTSTLSKIKPNRGGALEFAFRYSKLNLNDKDEHGGSQIDYNYGLNWYISDELRVMLNYVVAQPKETDDYDGLLQLIQGRVLFSF